MTRILLVEDHKIVRNGIRSILEKEPDFEIAGEAENGRIVLSLLESGVKADIIVTDVSMPEMDGITLSLMLSRKYPDIKVVVLSMMDNEKFIYEAFNNGVKGYLLKNTAPEELVFSIRHVARSNEIVCAELGMKMLRRAMAIATDTGKFVSNSDITSRELEILTLIAEGYTNSEIADKIFTSKRTVEGHRLNLINKTGVKNTAQLIKYACKAGLI